MTQPGENREAKDERSPADSTRKRVIKFILVLLVVLLVAAQLMPVKRGNPPVESDIPAPADVKAILTRSCYDCHSHEAVWPWYSYVAPVSWLIAHDVEEGREELNFSMWERYSAEKKQEKIAECWEEVEEGEMPLWFYLPLHSEARLSENDRSVLRRWAKGAGADSLGSHHNHDDEDDDSD